MPRSASARIVSHAARRAAGSKPVVGSSRKISSGSPTSARAKSSRRACPPDSLRARTSSDSRSGQLSGGQQRRLDLALALVGDPELIFLDEPTTGFDPAARRTAWRALRQLKELGKTVLLTTHYLEEAQELADRVAIVKDGLIVAEGPPSEVGSRRSRSSAIPS